MRQKDPELMTRISEFIGEYYRQEHKTPSTTEIASAVGISRASAYNYLVAMDKRDLLSYQNGQISNLNKIERSRTGYFSAPLVGSVRCGDPETEEEQVEMYVSLPESLFGKGEFYLLRAQGDSMVDVGISEGDLVLIRKQVTCEEGDIVVALDEDNQNTLKTFAGIDEENGYAILAYENKAKYKNKVIHVRELRVQGVATNVIKSFG